MEPIKESLKVFWETAVAAVVCQLVKPDTWDSSLSHAFPFPQNPIYQQLVSIALSKCISNSSTPLVLHCPCENITATGVASS